MMRIAEFFKDFRVAFKPSRTNLMVAIKQEQKLKQLLKFLMASMVALVAFEPAVASAAVTGGAMTSFQDGIDKLTSWMTGTIAKSLAILAIIVLGFMAMAGKLQMETAGKVILGIVLIFSAAQIVGLLIT